jgi:hypothetical protein
MMYRTSVLVISALLVSSHAAYAHDEGAYHGDIDMACVNELVDTIDAKAEWTADSDPIVLFGDTLEFAGCAMGQLQAALDTCKDDPETATCLSTIAQAARVSRFNNRFAANELDPFDALTERVLMFSEAGMDAQHGQCLQSMSAKEMPAEMGIPLCDAFRDAPMIGIINGLSRLQELR